MGRRDIDTDLDGTAYFSFSAETTRVHGGRRGWVSWSHVATEKEGKNLAAKASMQGGSDQEVWCSFSVLRCLALPSPVVLRGRRARLHT